MDEKINWKEYSKRYKETTKMIKEMPVDELLNRLGYPTTTPNRLEEASPVDNPELDAAIKEHLIAAEA